MSTYDAIAWLPLCAGLTGLGLVLSYLVGRKRGLRAFLRGTAWSLLPVAAYLTGSIKMFWKIGSAIGDFASAFVFSPRVWSGIGVAGLAAVLFIATAGGRRRRAGAGKASRSAEAGGAAGGVSAAGGSGRPAVSAGTAIVPATPPDPVPVARKPKSGGKGADDDMKEIEDILRQRGIT